MAKPIIIAICGKSASGKDSFAEWLYRDFKHNNIPAHYIVGDTTRDIRYGERQGFPYNFISKRDFLINAIHKEYLEYAKFRGWYYGTAKTAISSNKINIGIFNRHSLNTLVKQQKDFTIIPVYLDEKLGLRLMRSYDRENKWKIEFFRRAMADWRDFKNIQQFLPSFKYHIVLHNQDGVLRKSLILKTYLKNIGIL